MLFHHVRFDLNYNMNKDGSLNDIGNRFPPSSTTLSRFLSFSLSHSLSQSPIKSEFQSASELTYKVLEISCIFSGVTQYPRYEITRKSPGYVGGKKKLFSPRGRFGGGGGDITGYGKKRKFERCNNDER